MIKIKIKLVKISNFVKNNLKLFDNTNVMGGCYTEAVQHWHSSSCPQSRCSGWVDRDGADPYKDDYYWGFCTVCGAAYGGNTQASFQCSKVSYNCGYSQGQFFGYRASGCGKSNA